MISYFDESAILYANQNAWSLLENDFKLVGLARNHKTGPSWA